MEKKILYLRTDICDQELCAGGSVAHTIGVLQGFNKLGYVIVCASSSMIKILQQSPYIHALKQLKNPWFVKPLRWKINCLLSNIFFTYQAMALLKKQPIDFIYQRYSLLNFSGILLSAIKKIPLILEYNGSEAWVNQHWVQKKWFQLQWLSRKIELINLTHANYIVVVSDVLKEDLIAQSIDPKKILVNPNGVDTNTYNPGTLNQQRATIRKTLNVEKKFIFGFVGTFAQWHGIATLQHIIPILARKYQNAHFLLIGDGILCNNLHNALLENKSIDRVTFTGIVSPEQARDYLAACDAFLCPTEPNVDGSRFFGSPTKLFEYMSLAKPIIASDLEQLAQIIYPAQKIAGAYEPLQTDYHDVVGFLAQPKQAEQFITAASIIIELPLQTRTHIGNNARKLAVQKYSWYQHVYKIHQFITGDSNASR